MPAITKSGSPTNNGDSSYRIDATGADQVAVAALGMSATQGWIAARVKLPYSSATAQAEPDSYVFQWGNDLNNRIYLSWHYSDASWAAGRKSAGSGSAGSWLPDTFAANAKRTVILRWSATEWAVSVDTISSGAFASLGNTNIPTLTATALNVFCGGGLGSITDDQLGADCLWWSWGTNGAISVANAATIDAFGDTDKLPSDFPASCIGVWQANTDSYLSTVLADPIQRPVVMTSQAAQRASNW